uniref:CCHC-type domain-containing protein n=1 Tax=Nicotiana tabacum TaxID=4097 RepID=A0A1S3Z4M6_TOBAC|nr:PREDICTED: uncharacterized protein LOC107782919 [Nicotiana tabacum]
MVRKNGGIPKKGSSSKPRGYDICHKCGKPGHLIKDSPLLKQVIGFQREKTPYNPHRKYVTIPDNWLCTHCGNTGHFKETCKAKFQSQQKNKVFAKKGAVKGSSQ